MTATAPFRADHVGSLLRPPAVHDARQRYHADRLGPEESRWYIAHALGHKTMHPGNQLWVYRKTLLGYRYEREAQDFAHALLTDDREAMGEGLTCSLEVADYFGVPEEFVRVQAPPEVRRRAGDRAG